MQDLRTMLGGTDSSTFLGLDPCDVAALDGLVGAAQTGAPAVVVIGAPCATPYVSVGPYCAAAPEAIRRASRTYSGLHGHWNFDLGAPAIPDGAVVLDGGDIEWDAEDFAANRARITEACARILAAGAVPVVLGGDDSIPIPFIQAYAGSTAAGSNGALTIVQIDAHIDWRDEVNGERMGLSSTMRRSSEMAHVGTMIQIGQRGVGSARQADVDAALARGVHFVSGHDVHRYGVDPIRELIPEGSDVLVTIDVDGLDPTVMPGVIGPEPGGLSYYQAIDVIDMAAERGRIAGFDVVEFVPERDVNGLGALTAFRLTAHAIGRILQS
ncbi:MAG: arginase [Acidimicrobiales bacterium]|nr:arginase [Acidimicrobiales bacterium]